MKRMLTLALGAVIATSALPAFSQDNFPDTQENHWAYEALKRMRDAGLLVGYPDGLYRGSRPASRYEMAVALHALYQHLKGLADGLEAQHNALAAKVAAMGGTEGLATKEELRQVQEALATTKAALDGMKAWGEDIAALKRMTATFERELASMGVDIEALKKGVQDLDARVTALEKRKPPVNFKGDITLAMIGGGSDNPWFGTTVDARPTGVGSNGELVGGLADNSVYHKMAVDMTGTIESGPNWHARFIGSNMLGGYSFFDSSSNFGMGNMSWVFPGEPFGEPATEVWFQRLEVVGDTSLWGQNFGFRAGRVGHKLGNWFFSRIDNTPYIYDPDFDDGKWTFDGAVFDLKLGSANLNVFGGRQSERFTTFWTDINPMWAGNHQQYFSPGFDGRPYGVEWGTLMIDQHLGASLGIPISDRGNITLNYLIGDSNETVGIGNSLFANKVIVFGGEAKFMLNDRLGIYGGYSQSNLAEGNDNTVDENNAAWWASIGYKANRWNAKIGYQSIEPLFGAPGNWDRIGMWWNPTGIEGVTGKIGFDITDKLHIMARGGHFRGVDIAVNGAPGMTEDDKLSNIVLSLHYKLNDNWNVMLGAESVKWELDDLTDGFSGGEPTEKWYRLGLKYRFSENVWWSFLWEVSDYDSDGLGSFFTPWGDEKAKGYIFATQFGIKF